jgi:TRAP-type C4-dicarboxylate transport system permease small subunit
MKSLGKGILNAVPKISLVAGVISLCTMVVFVTMAVGVRYFIGISLHFAIEFTEYLIPVLVLWGAAYTMKEDAHINVSLIVSHLPAKVREWIVLVGYIMGLGYIMILIKYQLDLALYNISIGSVSDYPTQTELGWVQLVLPIGLSLLVFQTIVEIVRKFRRLLSHIPLEAQP